MTTQEIIDGLTALRALMPGHPCRGCDLCRRAEVLEAAIKALDVFCSNCGKGILQGAQLLIECRDCRKIFDDYAAQQNKDDDCPCPTHADNTKAHLSGCSKGSK
jgi:hypothetical protein